MQTIRKYTYLNINFVFSTYLCLDLNYRSKTVNVTLWGELAMKVGAELEQMVNECPIIAIKYAKVGDFQGKNYSVFLVLAKPSFF